jgi:hypothetical protein
MTPAPQTPPPISKEVSTAAQPVSSATTCLRPPGVGTPALTAESPSPTGAAEAGCTNHGRGYGYPRDENRDDCSDRSHGVPRIRGLTPEFGRLPIVQTG